MESTATIQRNGLIDLNKIKRLCGEKGLSIAELGRRVGLPMREQIHRRLNNQYTITADEVYLIADALEVPSDFLRLEK